MMTLSVVTHSQWAQPTMLRRLKIAILIAGLQSADVVLLLYRAGRLIVMFLPAAAGLHLAIFYQSSNPEFL